MFADVEKPECMHTRHVGILAQNLRNILVKQRDQGINMYKPSKMIELSTLVIRELTSPKSSGLTNNQSEIRRKVSVLR